MTPSVLLLHTLSTHRCARLPQTVQYGDINMEMEEVQTLVKAWPIAVGSILLRRRRLLRLKARSYIRCKVRHTSHLLCLPLLQRLPQHNPPTTQLHHLPPRLSRQPLPPSWRAAARPLCNHCCYHTPRLAVCQYQVPRTRPLE